MVQPPNVRIKFRLREVGWYVNIFSKYYVLLLTVAKISTGLNRSKWKSIDCVASTFKVRSINYFVNQHMKISFLFYFFTWTRILMSGTGKKKKSLTI